RAIKNPKLRSVLGAQCGDQRLDLVRIGGHAAGGARADPVGRWRHSRSAWRGEQRSKVISQWATTGRRGALPATAESRRYT
ncbi:MAG TPA: hypothetical protein PKA84_00335, partial [Rubrivivax sp.]|nr:hypothetical protein [Rubrivivax sp.]